MTRPGLEPGPLDPESSALTTRPRRLPLCFKYVRQKLFSVVLLQRFRLFLGSSSHFEGVRKELKSCFHFVIIYLFIYLFIFLQ